jgi:hypothetical protein
MSCCIDVLIHVDSLSSKKTLVAHFHVSVCLYVVTVYTYVLAVSCFYVDVEYMPTNFLGRCSSILLRLSPRKYVKLVPQSNPHLA